MFVQADYELLLLNKESADYCVKILTGAAGDGGGNSD